MNDAQKLGGAIAHPKMTFWKIQKHHPIAWGPPFEVWNKIVISEFLLQGTPYPQARFTQGGKLPLFFQWSTIQNNTQTTSTPKEHSTTMASLDNQAPNEHQQTFIDLSNTYFNTDPYKWQYDLGGKAIEAVAEHNPFCLLGEAKVSCTKCSHSISNKSHCALHLSSLLVPIKCKRSYKWPQ